MYSFFKLKASFSTFTNSNLFIYKKLYKFKIVRVIVEEKGFK